MRKMKTATHFAHRIDLPDPAWDRLTTKAAIEEAHHMIREAMRYAEAQQLRYGENSDRESDLIARSLERINASRDRLAKLGTALFF